jgi:hypothetical protein
MNLKTVTERLDIDDGASIALPPKNNKRRTLFPFAIFFAMVCAILLMDAILPLRDLWFHEAQLTQLGSWPVLPSLVLFPAWALIPPVPHIHITGVPGVVQSWAKIPLLLGSFVTVFLVYLLALRRLPEHITRRYLFRSTILFGIMYMLIPIVTSPDLYSYIAYARIGVIHHMNPLTTLPIAIRTDEIYNYIYWVDQPSAYGPTWAIITCALQWLITLFGSNTILLMVIALRVFGLLMHLASVSLIWSISGQLQRLNGVTFSTTRLRATLAFAWNPLLLFEACANAHNDTMLLTLVLLAIWFLLRSAGHKDQVNHARRGKALIPRWSRQTADAFLQLDTDPGRFERYLFSRKKKLPAAICAAAMLAFATCLKINVVLLVPGLLIYVWMQEPASDKIKRVLAVTATYGGLILLLYAPFWQGGAIFDVFSVNPATYRTINTLADFLGHFYNGIVSALGFPIGEPIGSLAERFTHTLTLGAFVMIYLFLCFRLLRASWHINTIDGLIRWMAVIWLVYCAIGSPWFWPWYIVTFFGLFALLEASNKDAPEEILEGGKVRRNGIASFFDLLRGPAGINTYFVRLLTFSMLSLYTFTTWGPLHTFVPGLPGFLWSYLSGLWAWILPLVGTALLLRSSKVNIKVDP